MRVMLVGARTGIGCFLFGVLVVAACATGETSGFGDRDADGGSGGEAGQPGNGGDAGNPPTDGGGGMGPASSNQSSSAMQSSAQQSTSVPASSGFSSAISGMTFASSGAMPMMCQTSADCMDPMSPCCLMGFNFCFPDPMSPGACL
jgi:hypothetical protein